MSPGIGSFYPVQDFFFSLAVTHKGEACFYKRLEEKEGSDSKELEGVPHLSKKLVSSGREISTNQLIGSAKDAIHLEMNM